MYMNQVTICGRLTRDPELRTLESGSVVATFSMATNEFWTDKQGEKQEKTEFHNIVVWGKLAEVAGQYLMKGQECLIQGKLQTREYQGKDGIDRRTTEVVASFLQLGQRPGGNRAPAPDEDRDAGRATPEEEARMEGKNNITDLEEEADEIRIEDVPF